MECEDSLTFPIEACLFVVTLALSVPRLVPSFVSLIHLKWDTWYTSHTHQDKSISKYHNKNLSMQYTGFFSASKIENFIGKKFDIFLIFAQNIDCGYTLEPPRRGGSNEYPQSMFWSKNKKNRYTPAYPSFAI